MKQRIVDGILQWVRNDAPVVVKMAITPEMVKELAQAICDQLEAEDFDKIDK